MSMIVRKKPQEETAMEKRNTAIINFVLVALVPLLLVLFLGFSLKSGTVQNEENLNQKFIELTKKHETLNQNINDLIKAFNTVDTIYNNLDKKDYLELSEEADKVESKIDWISWDNNRESKIDGFRHKIDKIKDKRQSDHDDELQRLLEFGTKWIKEIASAKDKELLIRKINREQVLAQLASGTASDGTDLQAKVSALENELALTKLQLGTAQEDKVKSDEDAKNDKSSLQRRFDKVLESNKTLKAEIEKEVDAINQEILPALEGGIFSKEVTKKLKDKLSARVNNIGKKTSTLKTDD